jgi:DNA topoisomerase-1
LQATGRDARGRKHIGISQVARGARRHKNARTMAFAKALPKIRAPRRERFEEGGPSTGKSSRDVVKLLEVSLIRSAMKVCKWQPVPMA